jgi:hypothetical protein
MSKTQMKYHGRLLVRKGRVAGLFVPLRDITLKNGIWEIREILGELTLVYIGEPAMQDDRYQSLSVQDLLGEASAVMTKEEWKELTSDSWRVSMSSVSQPEYQPERNQP